MSVKRLLKVSGIAAGTLVVLAAVYGLTFHTQAGRDLVGYKGRCPVAVGRMSTSERDSHRRQVAQELRGTLHAASRPALGFAFESTSKADIETWAARVHAECNFARAMDAVECKLKDVGAVPDGHVPAGAATLFFQFDGKQRLKAVDLQADGTSVEAAAAALQRVRREVAKAAGDPVAERGKADAVYLAKGTLTQASAEFRFDNYYAVARATNMGSGNYSISQSYRSLVD